MDYLVQRDNTRARLARKRLEGIAEIMMWRLQSMGCADCKRKQGDFIRDLKGWKTPARGQEDLFNPFAK